MTICNIRHTLFILPCVYNLNFAGNASCYSHFPAKRFVLTWSRGICLMIISIRESHLNGNGTLGQFHVSVIFKSGNSERAPASRYDKIEVFGMQHCIPQCGHIGIISLGIWYFYNPTISPSPHSHPHPHPTPYTWGYPNTQPEKLSAVLWLPGGIPDPFHSTPRLTDHPFRLTVI